MIPTNTRERRVHDEALRENGWADCDAVCSVGQPNARASSRHAALASSPLSLRAVTFSVLEALT